MVKVGQSLCYNPFVEGIKKVVFTKHAQEKFQVLKRHKVIIKKEQVTQALFEPLKIEDRENGTFIASGNLTLRHIIRVVYKKEKIV